MSDLRYDGRVVVVTGAGAGLGRTYALLFASRGAKVVVNDLGGGRHGDGGSSKAADSVVEEIKKNGGTAVADYNSVVEGEKIIKTALDSFGRVDVVINNAGILRDKSFARISDQDWDLIHAVHLKGSFKTTQAAFPHFKKQGYGRVIMTSSNAGLFGNFGQANYSAAKMGLVGLSNTIAIEGAKYNIHCNVIVPTAASRLTEDILPPDMFAELKPELIAPVVAYLCHESCTENGSIIDSAAGWAGKCHIVRARGALLRKSYTDGVTIENVRDRWSKVTDMSDAVRLETIQEATAALMGSLEELKSGQQQVTSSGKQRGQKIDENSDVYTFTEKDAILYALGVGASVTKPDDFKFLYENAGNFSILPTFYILHAGILHTNLSDSIIANALPGKKVNYVTQVLHGEQYLEFFGEPPKKGKLISKLYTVEVLDKGSGAALAQNVGASVTKPGEFKFLYENDDRFSVLPSFYICPALNLQTRLADAIFEKGLPGQKIISARVLHGEQYIEFFGEPPKNGKLISKLETVEVLDKGTGAVMTQHVGASVTKPSEFKFLYENDENFTLLPTFYILPALQAQFSSSQLQSAIPGKEINLAQVLHGEQYIEFFGRAPTEGKLISKVSTEEVLDKGSGAAAVQRVDTFNEQGELIIRNQIVIFVVGAGGFGGPRTGTKIVPTQPKPARSPDLTLTQQTNLDQAALYRLSGDMNPLHIDPQMAAMGGFNKPILHGLCTLGFSVRLLLGGFADSDPSLVKAVKARFMKPVYPGQTLQVNMWKEGNRIHFETVVLETKTVVIGGAYVDLKSVKMQPQANKLSAQTLESDAVFEFIIEQVNADPNKAKSIGGVFLYNITKDGKQVKQWTMDLKNAKVWAGAPESKPSVTLTISDEDFMQLSQGKLQPQTAFMKGKLKVTGNIMLAQKLAPLLRANAKL